MDHVGSASKDNLRELFQKLETLTQPVYSIRRSRPMREIRILGSHSLQHRANVVHTLGGRSLAAYGLLARNARRAVF